MNTLKISFKFSYFKNPLVYIDGKLIFPKRNNFGNYTYTLKTNSDKVNLKIINVHELEGKLWFILSYLFFLISLLGIFDKKIDKSCKKVQYESTIDLIENSELTIEFPRLSKTSTETIISKGNVNEEVITNNFYIDNKLKKRIKILKIAKILTWIASAILITIITIILLTR